jgi:hypothetical protein
MIIKNKTANSVILGFAAVIVIGLLFVFNNVLAAYTYSWKAPTFAPLEDNEPRPLNVSNSPDTGYVQNKQGGLILNTSGNAPKGLALQNGNLDITKGNFLLNALGLYDNRLYFWGDKNADDSLSLKASENTAGVNNWILPPTTGNSGDSLIIDGFDANNNAVLGWGSPTDGMDSDGDWIFTPNDNPTELYTTYFARVGSNTANIGIPHTLGNFYIQDKLEVDGDIWARNPSNTTQKAAFNHVDIYGDLDKVGWNTAGIVYNTDTGVFNSGTVDNGLVLSNGALKWGGNLTGDTTLNLGDYGLLYNLGNTGVFRVRDNASNYPLTIMKNGGDSEYSTTFGGAAYFNNPVYVNSSLYDNQGAQGQTGYLLQSTGAGVQWMDPADLATDNFWQYDNANNNIYSTYFARVGSDAAGIDAVGNPGDLYVQHNLEADGTIYGQNLNLVTANPTIRWQDTSLGGSDWQLFAQDYGLGFKYGNDWLANMFISQGNPHFGIGTDSPLSTLHVFNATGSDNAEIAIQSNSGAGQHWGLYNDRTTDDLRFWKDGANRFAFSAGGDLSVSNDLFVTGAYHDSTASAGANGFLLQSTGNGTTWMDPADLTADTYWQYDGSDLYATYFARVGTDVSGIEHVGSVGDFYTQGDLEVNGDSWLSNLHLGNAVYDNNDSTGTDGYVLRTTGTGVEWANVNSLDLSADSDWIYGSNNDIFSTYFARVGSSASDISAVGNPGDLYVQNNLEVDGHIFGKDLGLGTITPGYGIDLVDNDSTGILNINNTGTALWTGTRLARDGTEKWFIGMDSNNDNLLFRHDGTTNDFYLNNSGDLFAAKNVHVGGGYYDSTNTSGVSGYVLASTNSGTAWKDVNTLVVPDSDWIYDGNDNIYTTYFARVGAGTTSLMSNPVPGDFLINGRLETKNNAYFDGKIGVGTDSPAYAVDIRGNTVAQSNISLDGLDAAEAGVIFKQNGATKFGLSVGTGNTLNKVLSLKGSTGNTIMSAYFDGQYIDFNSTLVIVEKGLTLKGQLRDSLGVAGSNNNVLTSTGTATKWADINSLVSPDSDWQYSGNQIFTTYFARVGDSITDINKADGLGDLYVQKDLEVDGNLYTNLTQGSVPFIGTDKQLTENNGSLFWDNTNKRLGVGLNNPAYGIDLYANNDNNAFVNVDGADSVDAGINFSQGGTSKFAWALGSGSLKDTLYLNGASSIIMSAQSDASALDVRAPATFVGSARFNSDVKLDSRVLDKNNEPGQAGYLMLSTNDGVAWTDPLTVETKPDSDWIYDANGIYSTYYARVGTGTAQTFVTPTTGNFYVSGSAEVGNNLVAKNLAVGSEAPTTFFDVNGTKELGKVSGVSGSTVTIANAGVNLDTFIHVGDTITIKYYAGVTSYVFYLRRTITDVGDGILTVDHDLPNGTLVGSTCTGTIGYCAATNVNDNYSIGQIATFADNAINFNSARVSMTSGSNSFVSNIGNIDITSQLPSNIFVGLGAGNNLISDSGFSSGNDPLGGYDSGFGLKALDSITTGYRNAAFGSFTLQANTTGNENAAFGSHTLSANQIGNYNSAFGSRAMEKNRATDSSNGSSNVAFGFRALQENLIGNGNVAIGSETLRRGTTGNYNTALGWAAGFNANGDNNLFLGDQAGYSSTATYGSGNIFLGSGAGANETGSDKFWVDNSGGGSTSTTAFLYGQMYNNSQNNPFLRVNGNMEIARYNSTDISNKFNAELKLQSTTGTNSQWGIYHQGISDSSNVNSLVLWKKVTTDNTGFEADRFAFSETGNLSLFGNPYTSVQNPRGNNNGNNMTGQLRFYETDAPLNETNSNYVGFRAKKSLSSTTMWTLPGSDGDPGQVMTTDGSGALSWNNLGDDDWYWDLEHSSLYTYGTQAGDDQNRIINGNIGIGTNNPRKKLEVSGSFKATEYYSDDGGPLHQGIPGHICYKPEGGVSLLNFFFEDGLLICGGVAGPCSMNLQQCLSGGM